MNLSRLYFFMFFLCFTFNCFSQHCGVIMPSNDNVCLGSGIYENRGFEQSSLLPCIQQGQSTDLTISFTCIESGFTIGGQIIDSIFRMRIDSINGLPCGLCWSSNKSDNTIVYGEEGCIRIIGITTDTIGQYLLNIKVSIDKEGSSTFSYNNILLEDILPVSKGLILRLINSSSECPLLDTIGTFNIPSNSCN
jgi:hypothetical protein